MERIEKTVFISYRRTNIPWALAIFQNLHQHGYDVFFDYNGIASGDFESVILGNITARAHFLVLLTPSALENCDKPADWLRCEIETALDSRRNIVPLMLEGFDFGSPKIASQLTGKLTALKRYNGLSIPPEYFLEAMGRLRERFLNVPLTAVLHPASPSAQVAATEQKAAADAAPQVQEKELTAQQWYERGFDATDLDEQLRFYTQAIRLKPDFAEAVCGRGILRIKMGDREGALKDFNEAIRLKPDFAGAFTCRGSWYGENCKYESAFKDYYEAIRFKPDFAEAFYGRGIVRSKMGDIKGALKDFNEAIRLKSDYVEAYTWRGNWFRENGDYEGAFKDYNEAIRIKPNDAGVFNNRGDAFLAKGDLEGALQDCNEAIRLKPDFAEAFDTRGSVRSAMGDPEGALKDYNEAIRLKLDLAEPFYKRSITRDAMGDKEGASEDYNEAIRLGYKPKA
jgi:tetratricopeptide (TPR) repeat protein